MPQGPSLSHQGLETKTSSSLLCLCNSEALPIQTLRGSVVDRVLSCPEANPHELTLACFSSSVPTSLSLLLAHPLNVISMEDFVLASVFGEP